MKFEYKCTKCSALFDEEHSIGKAPQYSVCPACYLPARKIVSSVGIIIPPAFRPEWHIDNKHIENIKESSK